MPFVKTFLLSFFLLLSVLSAGISYAAGDAKHPKQMHWAFDGFFGAFDRASIQRGFQVYKQVCSSCHSMHLKSYRNLTQIGFSEDEVKAIAAEYMVMDGPDDSGDMFERPGRPSDRFVSPYPNEKAARASNGGAYPPDLSLITKARVDGPNYVYSLLTGYEDAAEDVNLRPGQYYNPYMPGGKIAMPPQLSDGLVEYMDGTEATEGQIARDVVNFLQWAAEPEMEARKQMGHKAILFALILTILFYFSKKRIWSNLSQKD